MNDTDQELWMRLQDVAKAKYDGHMTILRFTTNWRVGFRTPKEREQINDLAVGETFAEAAQKALSQEAKKA